MPIDKRQTQLRDIQNRIRGSRFPFNTFLELRGSVTLGNVPPMVHWLRTVPGIYPNRFPKSVSELCRDPLPQTLDLRTEIGWATATCIEYAERISEFLELSANFQDALLLGRHDAAQEALDNIEAANGISIWGIENRIAMTQRFRGLEQQKLLSQSIIKSRDQFDVLAFMVFYFSQRNEESTTPGQFFSRLASMFGAWGEDLQALVPPLWFRLTGMLSEDAKVYAGVLRFETASPLIDYYDVLVRLGVEAIVKEDLAASTFVEAFSRLTPHIGDYRVLKALYLAKKRETYLDAIPIDFLEAKDSFLRGNLDDANWASRVLADEAPSNVPNWLLRALITSDDHCDPASADRRSIVHEVTTALRTMTFDSADVGNVAHSLMPLCLNNHNLAFSIQLRTLLVREASSEVVTDDALTRLAFVYSSTVNVEFVPSSLGSSYLCYIQNRVGRLLALQLEQLARSELDEGSKLVAPLTGSDPQVRLAEMQAAFSEGAFLKALVLCPSLEGSPNQRTRRLACRIAANSYLALGCIDRAVAYIASRGIRDLASIRLLPVARCANVLDKGIRASIAAMISTPILLDLYARYGYDDLLNVRAYAFEDFLAAHGLTRPSQLRGLINEFDKLQLIYFLRHISVRDNMQMSIAFDGTRDLENERVAVCQLLTTIDSDRASEYNSEIRDILLAQTIAAGVRHTEQSKIYVDREGALRWAALNLNEDFLRLQALIRAGLGDSVAAQTDDDLLDWDDQEITPLAVPSDEASGIFFRLVRVFFQQLTLNPQFGLDCYLSMRIRHGTLSGQLRSALVERHVITQRRSDTNEYQSNEYWSGLLEVSPEIFAAIDQRLGFFSRECDNFIDEMNRDLIQIRRPEKPAGLFDFYNADILREAVRGLLGAVLESDTTPDEFFAIVLTVFWNMVDRQLKTIREYIDAVLKARWNHMFVDLERDLADIAPACGDLDWAVKTSQTESQRNLEQVKDWFRLAKPELEAAFTFDELLDIGLAVVKKIYPDFEPKVTRSIAKSMPSIQGLLIYLSDILFIIFDNIRRHSGLTEPEVLISADVDGEAISMRVENDCASWCRTASSDARVSAIRASIKSDRYQTAVTSEGGTGLMKIRKIIGPLQQQESFDFGFAGTDRFFVSLRFRYRASKNENIDY